MHAWLLYLVGGVIFGIGLGRLFQEPLAQKHGLEKLVALGPVLLAVPVAVFGTEHFLFPAIIAGMVPSWLPGHLFWALFVGVCLVGAALSISLTRYAGVTAVLLGVMIFLFVLLIHIPAVLHSPGTRLLWVVALRDLVFAGGGLAVAAVEAEGWSLVARHWLVTIARCFVGFPIIFLGVQQFLHPELAPGVPLAKLTPLWLPAHLLWAYIAGAVFVVAGLSLVINREVRLAATWLGVVILVLVVVVYVPIVVAKPSDIANGLNYLADTILLSGSVLALAGAATWDMVSRRTVAVSQT